MKGFVNAKYSKEDLNFIRSQSDSVSIVKPKGKKIRQLFFKGSLICVEGASVEFTVFSTEFLDLNDRKCNGTIVVTNPAGCNSALMISITDSVNVFNLNFKKKIVFGSDTCVMEKISFLFNNYNERVSKVLVGIDTTMSELLMHEYFDFYFADVKKSSPSRKSDFDTFMQPRSEALVRLIELGKIELIFDIISLKNTGYSWSLAEGLWYYNSLHKILTKQQLEIVDSYNGKNKMIGFRSSEMLKEIYRF